MSVVSDELGNDGRAAVLDGRYELWTEIGRGATGVVWEAFDRMSAEVVAVKVLHQHLLSSARACKRFVREARSAAMLNHRHSVVVKAHGCGPTGEAFLVMERLSGVTFATLLQGNHPLQQPRAIRIIAQILEAVAAAHSMKVLHRDLKPNNVVLIERGGDADFVKVCDFGLAKQFDAGAISSLLTGHGEVCGTPAYMAPEQARGETLDARADIYAVGVMLFQAVVGRLPFQASSPFALASLHLSVPPPRPRDLRPDIFPPLESLILRALAKDKAERPSSADVFRADLLQIERDYQSPGRERAPDREADTLQPAGGAGLRHAKAKLVGIAGTLVGLLAAGTFAASRSAPSPGPATQTSNAALLTAPAPPALPAIAARAAAPSDSEKPSRERAPSPLRGDRKSLRPRAKGVPAPPANAADAPSLHAAEQRLTAGHIADACALGQTAAAHAPHDPAIWEFLGRCHMRLPDPRQARAYYRKYLALAPASLKASFIRAIVEQEGP